MRSAMMLLRLNHLSNGMILLIGQEVLNVLLREIVWKEVRRLLPKSELIVLSTIEVWILISGKWEVKLLRGTIRDEQQNYRKFQLVRHA